MSSKVLIRIIFFISFVDVKINVIPFRFIYDKLWLIYYSS